MIMSTKTIEPALDFLPVETGGKRPEGIFKSIAAFFAAVGDGLSAAHEYERLTAQGTPPQKAVEIVFKGHFADRR